MDVLLKGILLGFSIAAPVGPIGVLCIRKALHHGRLSGFVSGLGATVADLLYATVAALGLTLVADLLEEQQFWLRLIGGTFLIYLGIKTFFSKDFESKKNPPPSKSLLSDFLSTFFLTLTNPLTIFAFFTLFASFGLTGIMEEKPNIAPLLLGVGLGSSLWWILLSEGIVFFRKKIGGRLLHWVNRIAGTALSVFGLLSWLSLLL
jgi:threonine/homoserine/homoserine lactone efflux protein